VVELQALHQENLREIRKAKEMRVKQLDEECKLAIQRIAEDCDEQKRRKQVEAQIEALEKWTESKAQQKKVLRKVHSQEMSDFEQQRKAAVTNSVAAKAQTEAEFSRFTREMQTTSEREIANFKSQREVASNSEETAKVSYLAAASWMKVQVEAARSLYL